MPAALFGANADANRAADPCLCLQERHHALLVARERRGVIVAARTQLARKHVGFGHGEPRALAGKEGDAGGGVADQRHAALRPPIHADLADTVEVEIARIVHDLENPRAFPADIGKGSLAEPLCAPGRWKVSERPGIHRER